ncbi:MAG: choice-of-anchor D domain-containing protein, partial [Ignavibacteriae bacterium]|nr:choice-of-anchor D domain-containing protein [Ignavibacteriota bacterium]
PTLASPPNGATDQPTTVTLSWNASARATTYRLQVSTDSLFATTVFDDSTLTSTSQQVGPLANDTKYYWHVNAKNAAGTSAYSEIWHFTTIIAAPAAPTLTSLPNGATDQPTTVTLSWNASARATTYRLQVSTDSLFGTTAFDDSTLTDTLRQVGPLANSTTYYWRVSAKNTAGVSEYSERWNFRTTIGQSITVKQSHLEAFFNPGGSFQGYGADSINKINVGQIGGPHVYNFTNITFSPRPPTNVFWVFQVPKLSGHFPDSAITFGRSPDSIESNPVLLFAPDTLKGLGEVKIFPDTQKYLHAMPPELVALFPLTYPATWTYTGTAVETTYVGGVAIRTRDSLNASRTVTVDGYGTLIIPGYQLECLRIRYDVPPPDTNSEEEIFFFTREGVIFNIVRDTNQADTGVVQVNKVSYFIGGTVPPPIAPVLVSPANGDTNQPTTLTLVWNQVPTAKSYRVQVATDSNFAAGIFLDDSTVVDTTREVTGLATDTTYYWRVNAKSPGGTSLWSKVWKFRTLSFIPLAFNPDSVSFGDVIINQTVRRSVYIYNENDDTAVVYSVTSNNNLFTVSPAGGMIPPFLVGRFSISFSPTSAGLQNGAILFRYGFSSSRDTLLEELRVQGIGVYPRPATLSNVNNISMWLQDDWTGASWEQDSMQRGGLYYPRQTANAVFADGFVWGGFVNDQTNPTLRVGGQTYRTGLRAGRIISRGIAENPNDPSVRIYRIRPDFATADLRLDAAEINRIPPDRVTPAMIAAVRDQYARDWNEWPWQKGAPFYDLNGNGIKDNGENPGIAGADQVIWFVANDLDSSLAQSLYGSPPIGLETQITVWSYQRSIGALCDVIFKRVRLIYMGTVDLLPNPRIDSMMIAQWSDPDLGDSRDDYVGCDTTRSLGFVYNAVPVDSLYNQFRLVPPSLGYDILQGPIIRTGNLSDTATFDFRKIAGAKNLPMSGFTYFAAGSPRSDPNLGNYSGTRQWYNLLRGCEPRPEYPSCTPLFDHLRQVTRFELSGDPVTGQGDLDGRVIPPSDRRNVLSTGPFTMALGDTQEVIVATVGGIGNTHLNSITELKAHDDVAQLAYNSFFEVKPSITFLPDSIDFGTVPVGSQKVDSVLILNAGATTLQISSVFTTDSSFSVQPDSAILTPSSKQKFYVVFSPSTAGLRQAHVIFSHDAVGSPDTLIVSGTGRAKILSVRPDTLPFDTVFVASTRRDSISVVNVGTEVVTISSVRITGLNARNFSVDTSGFSLPPGDHKLLVVSFSPDTLGSFTALLNISSNAGNESVALAGVGTLTGRSTSLIGTWSYLSGPTQARAYAFVTADSLCSSVIFTDTIINPTTGDTAIVPSEPILTVCGTYSLDTLSNPWRIDFYSDGQRFNRGIYAVFHDSLMIELSGNGITIPTAFTNASFFARQALAFVPVPGPALAGSDVSISIALPMDFPSLNGTLFYRKAGQRGYDSLRLNQANDFLSGTIPADTSTLRGIEYYVRFAVGRVANSYPTVNPDTSPAIIRVQIPTFRSPVSSKGEKYKMISVPVELYDPRISSVLNDDYGAYNPILWRIFRWEKGKYQEYNTINAKFTPGTAFWLITRIGSSYDVENAQSVNSSRPHPIVLDTGWNQIANPFAFAVAWTSIRAAHPDSLKGPYYYDSTEYKMDISALQPWEGYFIRNNLSYPETLLVPPVEATLPLAKSIHVMNLDEQNEYHLQLSAETPDHQLKDSYNYVGLLTLAKEGDDPYDYPEPPPIGDYVQLSIMDGKEQFMTNFKPIPRDGQQWELQVSATKAKQVVQIALTEVGRMPEGFQLYILDKDNFNIIPTNEKVFDIELGEAHSKRIFKVILGTHEYATKHSEGIPLVPFEYGLEQNYPNPFNPETRIRYQLSKRSHVVFEIYNLLGQRIRTLVDEEQLTGVHIVVWNGGNNLGNLAGSGVYVYRIRAGDFVASRKLVIIR